MDISRTTYFRFFEHANRIGEVMKDERRFHQLLDEARRDTPIIDGMLDMLQTVMRMPEGRQHDVAFQNVMRDIHIMLALRSIAQMRQDPKASPRQQQRTSTPNPLPFRLRRASEN